MAEEADSMSGQTASDMGLQTEKAVAFSAPGKALLAGGYLVLFPEYDSFVVALSSRMHAVVESKVSDELSFTIKSPQFKDGEWAYEWRDGAVLESQGKTNPFIESCLNVLGAYSAASFDGAAGKHLDVTIYSDPGYHSQEDTTVKANAARKFLFHEKQITEVAKTGLGSSAGLVTVLTTAVLSQLKPDFDLAADRSLVHNLAQVAHCIAQKKIGSGFDVASATFGSIVYRRFQPHLIDELISGDFTNLVEIAQSEWDFKHTRCRLPPKIKLLMGDVSGGSNTPRLVSKVLGWRQSHPEDAKELFSSLDAANTRLVDSINVLNSIAESDPDRYAALLHTLETHSSVELASYSSFASNARKNKPLVDVIDSIREIRSNLRKLTRVTTAEIEPFSQTQLLNHCGAVFKGCLGGVVPGAGGYDAICLLCHEDSVAKISDSSLPNVSWLALHEDVDGVVQESSADYVDLD